MTAVQTLIPAMPLLAVIIPAVGALLIACTGERRANLREFWSVAAGVVMATLVACMIPDVMAERTPKFVLFRILPDAEPLERLGLLALENHRLAHDLVVTGGNERRGQDEPAEQGDEVGGGVAGQAHINMSPSALLAPICCPAGQKGR